MSNTPDSKTPSPDPLIAPPLLEAEKAQQELCQVYLDSLFQISNPKSNGNAAQDGGEKPTPKSEQG